MTALNALLERTGCAEELAAKPSTWEQLMTAVAAGAIDCDSVAEVTIECTAFASLAEPNGDWEHRVTEALFASDGDTTSEASQTLMECGRVADTWVQYGLN
ncbi:hypothetical protein ETAA8_40030 [Anatilimnocola aggregata]|uniref:Uncharacterized protein n=1 Tax=Anatilimnocola aggregata TaxID=2528021 RepID=A0A517YF86_9BACT|nr:hypothetical protein [Anatilimnocola aggregata]QDU28897.1 hypothetical protein ETAA8_40030 [Anatilimnocola aggregata]